FPARPDSIDIAVVHPEHGIVRGPRDLTHANTVANIDVYVAMKPEIERLIEAVDGPDRQVAGLRQRGRCAQIARDPARVSIEDGLSGIDDSFAVGPEKRSPQRIVLH